jgi:hypothetical protein
MLKHVDRYSLEKGTIRIARRNWRGDIDDPKTDNSKQTLALGGLAARYAQFFAKLKDEGPDAWVSQSAATIPRRCEIPVCVRH